MEAFLQLGHDFRWDKDVYPLIDWRMPLVGIAGYLVSTYFLHQWMKEKAKPFELKHLSKLHNVILVLWSLVMFAGLLNGSLAVAKASGLSSLWCAVEKDPMRGTMGFWLYIYYLSKYYELLDTVIIVLKKDSRRLSVLHVYHHAVIIWLSWSWLQGRWRIAWSAALFNCFVHVIMYSYYIFSRSRFGMLVKPYITSLQLVQFFTAVVNVAVFTYFDVVDYKFIPEYPFVSLKRTPCTGEYWTVVASTLVTISFIVLFSNFYFRNYKGGHAKAANASVNGNGLSDKKIQ